ncbi:MAG: hypothetical protein N2559_16905, partial [Anaerolineae bacterium]|nr:hypothetical protein [Anaerolineae bacterium]
ELDAFNCVGACFLYRRKVYETIGEYNPQARLAEDYEYWLRVRQKFVMVPLHQPLYYYRIHPHSLTGHSATAYAAQRVAHRVRRDLGIITDTEYRHALAQVDIDEAFWHYQGGNLAVARSLLVKGILKNSQWCRNRGVLSVLFQSIGIRRLTV